MTLTCLKILKNCLTNDELVIFFVTSCYQDRNLSDKLSSKNQGLAFEHLWISDLKFAFFYSRL